MDAQIYLQEDFIKMCSMHDFYASRIQVENNALIISYDDLDVQNFDITPNCKYKSLTVKYEFDSFCSARLFYGKNKYKTVDLTEQFGIFSNYTDGCIFMSYKYSVDCCKEVTLYFSVNKMKKGRCVCNKYWRLEIDFDALNIVYDWS
jgi:hypothetical protein